MVEWASGIAKLILPTPFPVGNVNVYLIKGDCLTLVDTGPNTDESWEALNSQLKELKLEPRDIEQVILTHHHPDHSGLLDRFSSTLEVYGHPNNERWIDLTEGFLQEYREFSQKMYLECGVPSEFFPLIEQIKQSIKFSCHRSLTGPLLEGDRPLGLTDWKVVETFGHAQSHIGLYREKDGVFISGDHLLAHISPNPILEPPLPGKTEREKSQLQYNHSLKKMLEYPISIVYNGHGEEVYDVQALVKKRLNRQHDRAMQIKQWLTEDSYTAFEICRRLFPKVYKRELALTISETIAQLDYLESLGEINSSKDGQDYQYSATK
ncbi:MBL fold metallo-hydrolase [Bacillus sp. V3B]|uniref:MBL fold metallo-hydrolase n=1 Tax=Bacillus sp. V3B TaxID=2804915 RepID=UPI002109DBE2|nr:MBL fold metallo-hydrolase [Bacillus sp. V3B]MCQ6273786.1 MBL fold metallo-hydrolase [Bacillus sp. V3B]